VDRLAQTEAQEAWDEEEERRARMWQPPGDNPHYPQPPDLQAMVERYGGWHAIPQRAWAEYDRAEARWQERRRIYTAGYCALPGGRKRRRLNRHYGVYR
jgi:hypothetical protein